MLFGGLLGCYGVGAIAGAALNPRIRARFDNENIVRMAFAGFAFSAVILGQTQSIWLHALALLPAGASWVLALSLFNVTVQLSTPRWVVARALALYQTATFGGMAAGSWVWGGIAGSHGVGDALTAAGGVLLAGAVIGHWFRAPDFGTADLEPLNRFREPALRIDLSRTLHTAQSSEHHRPIAVGETLTATATVTGVRSARGGRMIGFDTVLRDADGEPVQSLTTALLTGEVAT